MKLLLRLPGHVAINLQGYDYKQEKAKLNTIVW